jgi:hypothetical protein
MFAFLRKADHTTSRKARKGRSLHYKRPGVEPLEGRVVLDAAGDTLGTAENIGALVGQKELSDYIGVDLSTDPSFSIDSIDFFRFSLTNPGPLNVRLDGLNADLDLEVIRDFNNNGIVDPGGVIGSSFNGGTTPDVVNLSSLPADNNYFVRVNQFSGDTTYTLILTADYAGNSTAAARDLGTLLGRQSVSDFVGDIDTQDFYRINLAAPGSLNILGEGALQVLNSSGTVIASSAFITPDGSVDLTSLAAGTYFVAVNQYLGGDINYNLTLTADYAGNSTAAARNLGTLLGRQSVSDFVGGSDTQDFYRINLAAPGSLNVVLNGLGDVQVLNSAGTVIASSDDNAFPESVNLTSLAAGTYFVRVNQTILDTNYNLTLTADYAGNSTAAARNLGTLLGRQSVSDFVGGSDTQDFYRINLAAPGSLNVFLAALGADANLQVLNSAGTVIAYSAHGGTTPELANLTSLAAGTYFVEVNQSIGDTGYDLTLTADYAGNSMAAARDLGTFSGTQVFRNSDFVGLIDTNDFYRFNLTTSRTVTGTISDLSADADLQVLNSAGTVIASSARVGNAYESISQSLGPGTYYFRVYQSSGDTNYTFRLTTT